MSHDTLSFTPGHPFPVALRTPFEVMTGMADPEPPIVTLPEDQPVRLVGGGEQEDFQGNREPMLVAVAEVTYQGETGEAYVSFLVKDVPPGSWVSDRALLAERMGMDVGIPGPIAEILDALDDDWDDDRSALYAEGPDDLPF